jgi:integrase
LNYLRWKDINFGDEIITLTAYKGKGRNIKPKRWSVQMTSRLKKLWTTAYGEAGVPKDTRLFYSVRHNFGTEMANEGMPLPALANLLGHSDVKMTMRYYNMNKKTIDKARDILNRRAVVNT